MPPKEIQLPRELIQAIEKNELIVFVGAGLSWGLKNKQDEQLEGWKNLVVKILSDLEGKGFRKAANLRDLIDTYDLLTILDLIEQNKKFPRKEIANFIKEFFYLKRDNDFSLHKKIYQLSNKIITTNYDRAFEIAVEALERNTAYKGRNYGLATHKNPRASWLFKLHGCYYDMDSMVLFPSQYEHLYDNTDINAKHALATLHNIVYNKSVLFIGCGMGDFQINNIFSKIKAIQGVYNQNHFVITKYALDSQLNFLIPINIREHNEIPRIIDRLLNEKEKFEHRKSDREQLLERQVIETKEKLAKTEEELKHITDDVERMKKLLERESLKYFERGLEFQLNNELEKAVDEYKNTIELKKDHLDALNNWGTALLGIAKTKSNEEAEVLYHQAFEKYRKVTEIKPDYYLGFYNWGITLGKIAETKPNEEAETLYRQAIEKYEKAAKIKPDSQNALYNWGTALVGIAETKPNKEAETLYRQAIEKYEKAAKIKPDDHEIIYNLGNTLKELARKTPDIEAEGLLLQSVEKYQKVTKIKPDFYQALINWGAVLVFLAETKSDLEAETLYSQAIEKFREAAEIKPDFHLAYHNWGNTLVSLAKTKSDEEAEVLFYEAIEKYREATEIKPDFHKGFYNWGTLLGTLAKTKSDEEAVVLFYEAIEKHRKVTEIKSDFYQAFDSWGSILLKIAKTKSGLETKTLLQKVVKKLKKAVDLGGKKYNLACAYALLSDKENALLYLEQSLKDKEQTTNFVLEDEDWQAYLKDKDFKKIIQKYKDK